MSPNQGLEPNPQAAQAAAVINPYALAELVAGRTIPWGRLPDAPGVLEDILQTPYEELFDPKFGGPLYLGLKLNDKLELERVRSPLLDVPSNGNVSDLARPVELATNGKQRLERLSHVFTKDVLDAVAFDPEAEGASTDWTPPNGTWSDGGQFFQEAAEYFDPIQGAVANCYYIAALSAMAWAKPYGISHMTRATGEPQQEFTNMIRFYKPDSGAQLDREIEVTDTVPVNSASGGFIYARSSEAGEIWPAVYEKAYAKLKTGITGDHPDITATGWGDCVWATAQLNGRNRFYYDTAGRSADDLWNLVRANSMSRKTIEPMTAWTYSSGDASEKKIVYSDANIVASHCYTVLGWEFRNDRKYIILRNPWGNTEATQNALGGTVFLHDISWWRPINLTAVDGTFAIEASTFKTYFAGLGVAK